MNNREQYGDYETFASIINMTVTSFEDDELIDIVAGFLGNTKLTTVRIPNAKTIGDGVFENCTKLENVIAPNVESLGNSALRNTAVSSIDFPKLQSCEFYAFQSCKNLTEVHVPKLDTLSGQIFFYCTALEYLELPSFTNYSNSISTCAKLKRVDFSSLISFTSSTPFTNCTALSTVVLRNTNTVPTIAYASFTSNKIVQNITFYVPDSLVEDYKSATNWSVISDQIKPLSELPADEEES